MKMYSNHKEKIEGYLLCIDEGRYYDAHEELEELWFPRRFEEDNEIKLLKGFINAAVSFELCKRQREQPSKRAWGNYLKYRPLLYRVDSPHLNEYHSIARKIERLKYHKTI